MSIMNSEVYAALIEAGVTEPKAKAAAVSVAGYDTLFHALDKRLTRMEALLSINVIATVIGVVKAFL